MRLGIDLDGVVADFNSGWTAIHRAEFGSEILPEQVLTWDGLAELAGFDSMREFWAWASPKDDRPSIFRHLDPYPGAIESLHRLRRTGHDIVIVTTKPRWAVADTFRWLADHGVPTTEVHITDDKHLVDCDVYLDDSPFKLEDYLRHRADRAICRFVRPWNDPLDGVVDVHDWDDFVEVVATVTSATPSGPEALAPSTPRQ